MADPIDWNKLAPELLAGGAGTVDELLYGIPEYVAKKIDRKAVEDYIGKHKQAYKTGETIGTVGSIFMPVPGGAAIKGLDTASDILRLAGRGALAGAGEAGLRGVTSEKSVSQILRDIQRGATWGGVGGAAGGVISKGLKKIGKRAVPLAEKAVEQTDQAMLGAVEGLTGRNMNQLLKETAGPGAKGLGKYAKADLTRESVARIARENRLDLAGNAKKYIGWVDDNWHALGNIFNQKHGDIAGADLLKMALANSSDDIAKIAQGTKPEIVASTLDDLAKEISGYQGLNNIKGALADAYTDTFNASLYKKASEAKAARNLISLIRSNIDDVVTKTAEEAGFDPAVLNKLKKNYIFDRAIADASARAEVKPYRTPTGAQTAEKWGTQLALSGLGAGAGAATGETTEDRLKRAAAGLALTTGAGLAGRAMSAAAARGVTSAIAKGRPIAELGTKIAPYIAKAAEKITPAMGATAGGQAASIIARKAIGEAKPETPEQAEAAQTGASAGTGDTPAYMTQIMDRMQMYAQVKGVSVDSPEFAQFAQQVYQLTEGFAPEKVAGILYPGEAERKAYLTALTASRRLAEVMPTATAERPGFWQSESTEAGMARSAAVDQLAAIVGDVAKEKGSEAAAKKQLNKILAGRETPERKAQLVKTLLAQYGVDLEKLSAMGVA